MITRWQDGILYIECGHGEDFRARIDVHRLLLDAFWALLGRGPDIYKTSNGTWWVFEGSTTVFWNMHLERRDWPK